MKYTAIYLLTALVALSLFSSCKKDTEIENANQVGSSKIIYFPSVAINGDHLVIVNPGGTYTEAGAVAILNGDTTKYTITGGPVSGPGVYNLVYTASNPQNYTASDWRTVVILGNDISSNDFSGTYTRYVNGVAGATSTWTKTAPGIYTVENPGGAGAGVGLTVTAVNYSAYNIAIPQQISADFGLTSSANASTTGGAGGAITGYSWIFNAGGYGTSLRTFSK